MKILFVANPSGFTDQLLEAFVESGEDVRYFNDRENLLLPRPFSNSRFFWRIFRKISKLRKMGNSRLAKKLIKEVDDFKPDAIFVNKGAPIGRSTIEAIRSRGVKTMNWFPENAYVEPYDRWVRDNAGSYDIFASFDSGIFDQMKDIPHHKLAYFPYAVSPEMFDVSGLPEEEKSLYNAKIVFAGAMYPERIPYLEAIADLGLVLYGPKDWSNTSLSGNLKGYLSVRDLAKAYAFADISINLNTEPATNGVNLRTFEIPASGGFQMTDFRKDLPRLFEIDKEVVTFSSPQELRQKVLKYLNDKTLRDSIARAGHARVVRDHNLKKRIAEIIGLLKS